MRHTFRSRLAVLAIVALALPASTGLAMAGGTRTTPLPERAPVDLSHPYAEGVVLVGFAPGAAASERAAARRTVGGRGERLSPLAPDVEVLRLPTGASVGAAIAALRRSPVVAYAEPDYIVTRDLAPSPNDPSYTDGTLWGMYGPADLDGTTATTNEYGSNARAGWDVTTGSRQVVVGVIDEGIQITHPDLAANIWTNAVEAAGMPGVDDDGNGYTDDVNGWDFVNGDASVYDGGTRGNLDQHGTHVSGTIGAVGWDGRGVIGVSPQVRIVSMKFLGRNGGTTSNAARAVDYLTDLKIRHGLNIVASNNSWSGGGANDTLLAAIRRAGVNGILFVASAGNSGIDSDGSPVYPQSYDCRTASTGDCIISVAAIGKTGAIASWSNFGDVSVDIGAPGIGVVSSIPFDSYASYNGTSMSAPHVTGAIALCAAAALQTAAGRNLTSQDYRTILFRTSRATLSLLGKTVTNGRLDAGTMAAWCRDGQLTDPGGSTSVTPGPFDKTSPANGATGLGRQVTLTWQASTDAAGYQVCVKAGASATCGANDWTGTGATSLKRTLKAGTTYRWQVRAVGPDGTTYVYANDTSTGTWGFTT